MTLWAPSLDVVSPEGRPASFNITGNYSGTSSQPVVADVQVSDARFALDGSPTVSGSAVQVPLKVAPNLPRGRVATSVRVRLCTTVACDVVYPGSTQTISVNLDVQFKDWETQQRDAAHTGYVAAAYKTENFAQPLSGHAAGSGRWHGVAAGVGLRQPSRCRGQRVGGFNGPRLPTGKIDLPIRIETEIVESERAVLVLCRRRGSGRRRRRRSASLGGLERGVRG